MYRHEVIAPVRLAFARWLEAGSLSTPLTRALARAHAPLARRSIARPLRLPDLSPGRPSLVTVTVGGATLGGSGKTRLALACTRALAEAGAHVALIGHGYRAALTAHDGARIVTAASALEEVGDEALLCARALVSSPSARVVVGRTRQAAVELAARLAPEVDAVVFDGPLQLAPQKASVAVLALDAAAPWGSGALPPAGDLRAPREALLAAADVVVEVDATPRSVLIDGRPEGLDALAGLRLGLFTAIARPDRLERALERMRVVPEVVVRASDHGPLTRPLVAQLAAARADLWLTTTKCALHLETSSLGLRLGILDGGLELPTALRAALRTAWEMSLYCAP